jgi:DNA-binding NarL/FixJ family response regulator
MPIESQPVRTLIVGEPFYRDQLKELLNKQYPGMMLAAAEDGERAIKLIALFRPHLILMEITLPKRNGLSIARKMRALGSNAKIVLLSNDDLPEYRKATQECGANYFLPKATSTGADVLSLVNKLVAVTPNSTA